MRPDETLKVRQRRFEADLPDELLECLERSYARIDHPDGYVVVELLTDSPHLTAFFTGNWARASQSQRGTVQARIVALRGDAISYDLPASLDGSRWFSRKTNSALYLGNSSYTNLKITVRGLLAAIKNDTVMWVHGCTLSIRDNDEDYGILLLGRSGAGKTTITSKIRQLLGDHVRVVNDDYGAVSLATQEVAFTGERRLHMKYMSVATLASQLHPTPATHWSEDFNGDRFDATARLLIDPSEVFGPRGFKVRSNLRSIVVVGRDVARMSSDMSAADILDLVVNGEFSEYYGAPERFFNGSLFLLGETDVRTHRAKYQQLFDNVGVHFVNNVESSDAAARQVLETVVPNERLKQLIG
ncbi:hypothetical protein [Nocardia sp. NPDC049149]|uniref:hypothetical protein n=1 Tax=Nocardia sp. NPDC049149 TaxID=3364315 RepID=UPI00371C3FAC